MKFYNLFIRVYYISIYLRNLEIILRIHIFIYIK